MHVSCVNVCAYIPTYHLLTILVFDSFRVGVLGRCPRGDEQRVLHRKLGVVSVSFWCGVSVAFVDAFAALLSRIAFLSLSLDSGKTVSPVIILGGRAGCFALYLLTLFVAYSVFPQCAWNCFRLACRVCCTTGSAHALYCNGSNYHCCGWRSLGSQARLPLSLYLSVPIVKISGGDGHYRVVKCFVGETRTYRCHSGCNRMKERCSPHYLSASP